MDLIDVARLEEKRIARAVRELADEVRDVGGGVAGRGEPGLWVNMAVGVGVGGEVRREELEGVTRWYEERGIEARFEVCPYADPSVMEGLGAMGFVVRGFESVMFREVGGGVGEQADAAGKGDVREFEVLVVDPGDAGMVRAYAEAVAPQFVPRGEEVTEGLLELTARSIRHPRVVALAAWAEGRVVGGGALEIYDATAALFGLAVAPRWRRRGVQTALMRERLRIARERGARIATIGFRPGAEASGTERTARRVGFEVAYTKVIVARPGEGLRGVVG